MNNQKTKIIIVDFNLKNNRRYLILYCNFITNESLSSKLVKTYIIDNKQNNSINNPGHILVTMIPIPSKSFLPNRIIWQGYKNKDFSVEQVSQLKYNFHQLHSHIIDDYILNCRIEKVINKQTTIYSPRNKTLLSTPETDQTKFLMELNEENDNDMEHFLRDYMKLMNEKEEKHSGYKGLKLNDNLQLMIKQYNKMKLTKTIQNEKTIYNYTTAEKFTLIYIITNEIMAEDHLIKFYRCADDIRNKRYKLRHHKHIDTPHDYNKPYERIEYMTVKKIIYKSYASRRPMFYDNQILGLYKTINQNLLGTPRYDIKHIESDPNEPIICFIADINLIKNIFKIVKRSGFHHNLHLMNQFIKYDYMKYKEEINARKRVRFK